MNNLADVVHALTVTGRADYSQLNNQELTALKSVAAKLAGINDDNLKEAGAQPPWLAPDALETSLEQAGAQPPWLAPDALETSLEQAGAQEPWLPWLAPDAVEASLEQAGAQPPWLAPEA